MGNYALDIAASCAVRIFGDDPQNLLNQLRPLHSRWNREVLQFTACMPQLCDEMFEEFCELVLKGDDGTGAHCELVQDFLKGREGSAVVLQKMRDKLHEIRGTDSLVAGLCHPSMELRNRVLSEMKLFAVPPDPFSHTDGIVPRLKQIVEDREREWYEHAAAILSVVQIAQMDHCQKGTGRNDTLCWVLNMLGTNTHDDIHFALVTSLGTCLKGITNTTGLDCIMLASQDEQQLLDILNRTLIDEDRSISGLSEALADVKAFSEGLVDWVVSKSLIETGQWPTRHVLLFCEQITDSARASHFCSQLLSRVQASSIEAFLKGKYDLLKGLSKMLALSKILAEPHGSSFVLPFLENGKVHQRMIVLYVIADLNMQFTRSLLSEFARCLLSKAEDSVTTQSVLTKFLEQEYTRYQLKLEYEYTSLCEVSSAFRYLQSIMEPAVADGGLPHQVAEELKGFEMKVTERSQDRNQEGAHCILLENGPVQLQSEQKAENLSLETLAAVVKTFSPKMLKNSAQNAENPIYLYCAARLWETSGLMQQEEFDKWPTLSASKFVDAEDAFKNLLALRGPWMTGYGQLDGRWEQAVCTMMQDKGSVLGRLFFAIVLLHVQQTIQSHTDTATDSDKLKLLETKIKYLQTSYEKSDADKHLEQRFLLKELHIGCRSQQLPIWAGLVSVQGSSDWTDHRWKTLWEEDKIREDDNITYIDSGTSEITGIVQGDGRIRYKDRKGDMLFIDAVAFAMQDNTWASLDHHDQSVIDANKKLFACCYLICSDDDRKTESLEDLLSSCGKHAAPTVVGAVGKVHSSGKGKQIFNTQEPHTDQVERESGAAQVRKRAREDSPYAPSK